MLTHPRTRFEACVPVVRPFADVLVSDIRAPLLSLFGAVGLVLLIASANVANLLLMRVESRRGELALRAALGAGRARIVGEVLAESVLVGVMAGVTGFAIAWWSLDALVAFVPDGLPRAESVRIDAAVLVFSMGVVLVTALVAGIAPALLSTRAELMSHLRPASHGLAGSAASIRGRRTLVITQVALAVTVLAAAGLLIRTSSVCRRLTSVFRQTDWCSSSSTLGRNALPTVLATRSFSMRSPHALKRCRGFRPQRP